MYPYLIPIINGKTMRTKNKSLTFTVKEIVNTINYGDKISQFIRV